MFDLIGMLLHLPRNEGYSCRGVVLTAHIGRAPLVQLRVVLAISY